MTAPQQPSPEPQPIVTPLRTAAIFLVLSINPGGEAAARDLLADVAALQRSVGFRLPEADLASVVGIGSSAWERLFSGPRPAGLHPFRELEGAKHHAVATPGDLLFHLRANQMDLCFEFATQVMNRLAGTVTVQDEVHGFRYFDERDLMGFVDGTESPGGRAGEAAALVGPEDPDFTGGSYVIVQKYLHDMDAWNTLTTEEQERVIGRTKLPDIEIPDELKAPNSHLALNTIVDPDGTERQIVRANMPFGSPGQRGVRHVLHWIRRRRQRDRADAKQHVHRGPTRQPRPDPGLLHGGDRDAVLRPVGRLPRRPARPAAGFRRARRGRRGGRRGQVRPTRTGRGRRG